MKTVYEAGSAIEAHMLTDLLKQAGIRAWVRGEHLQGALGELPAAGLVRLEVDEADVLPARALLTQWEAEQPPAAPASPRPPVAGARRGGGWLMPLLLGLALGWVLAHWWGGAGGQR